MANYATLKAGIVSAIKENGNNEITGNLLQQQLLAMVNSLGVGYQYTGIATPATNPGTPDQNVFYLASTAGTYANFGGLELADGEIAILKYNGAWSKDSTGAATQESVNQLGQEKLDKQYTANLVDPSKVTIGKYIWSGGITDGNQYVAISDYIPVNGQNIITNGPVTDGLLPFAVYDASKNFLRSGTAQSTQYTYQSGDEYIRVGILSYSQIWSKARANYGTTLIDIPFSDNAPVEELKKSVNGLYTELTNYKFTNNAAVAFLQSGKLDKEYTANLFDPSKVETGKYISPSGIGNGTDSYAISDYIPVNGQDIITNGEAEGGDAIRAIGVYNASKQWLRASGVGVQQYTYQNGDAYIRVGIYSGIQNWAKGRANYGTTLIDVPYSDNAPVEELKIRMTQAEQDINSLEESVSTPLTANDISYFPAHLYKVWNNILTSRQYAPRLGLSRCLALNAFFNQDKKFSNGLKFISLDPTSVSAITESTLNVVGEKSITIRNTPASIGENVKPRILIIGDSVTQGYGANCNKKPSWLPSIYYGFAKMYFEMDKIDNGDSGHSALFVGGVSGHSNFVIDYNGISRDVRAMAEGKGGAALQEMFTSTWGGDGTANPFYDSVNNTFSILAYLKKYRTMDDLGVRLNTQAADPHGQEVIGSDGNTYTVGEAITSQSLLYSYDICTPTHIMINLNHNTTVANFQSNIANVVNIIKTELPSAVFAWLCIDSTGTNFPKDFPNYKQSIIAMTSLHTKNNDIYNYFRDNIEDESEDVYLLGMNFIQPEAIDYPYITLTYPNDNIDTYRIEDSSISGANYHPNNIAHAEWGYELYAFIKWLISK